MFTGIIETVGVIKQIRPRANYKLLTIAPNRPFDNIVLGESIAVDGCCLTVTEFDETHFTVEASQETLAMSIVRTYANGTKVNLERALFPTSRLGGHFVSGHVDCVGKVTKATAIGDSIEYAIKYPDTFKRFLVAKGSVAIDGISLTVNRLAGNEFAVNLIPHTQAETNSGRWRAGVEVNLEFDLLGKYMVRLLDIETKGNLTLNKLIESGW
ncbi:MAG: riboflavin synthase [candidate division Zixibacteria bacterium]|nr:riboflavin synthase [candidate division Zixibacteria bacterium]